MKKWRLAVFDWNGTLLDDLPVVYGSVAEIFETYGMQPPSLEEYRREIQSDFLEFYRRHGIPETATAEDLNAIRQNFFLKNWDAVKLNEHAIELLGRLEKAGIKKAILSSEIPAVLQKRLGGFGLLDRFDCVLGGAWPKSEHIPKLFEHIDADPALSFYVDDTSEGIASAKAFGLTTVGYTGGYAPAALIEKSRPDFVIRSLKEIPKILGW